MTIGAHRKVVSVLFCDVVGSTALGESVDPESLQALLADYFERMKGIVEAHGGSVEKFIGDAVMAVFGVPVAHEDDALRACRAAAEMRDALPALGVEGRIGVNTGEVLAGTEERLATGDAVNVAARLEQAAEPGEVLIGAETLALVGDAVEVGRERLLELKGKSEPVAAHSVVAVREPAERSHASRFVGRERELQQLADAWDRVLEGSRCELLTIVGDPGVGKSRLVAEAFEKIDARVVRGRCLPYGEGITYFAVVEVVKQLDALPSDEQAATALRSLLGESDASAGTDEIAWAFRKLLEEQAPLVICLDDIQWGEETFLALIESTALLSSGAPLLLVCMARPELLDRRPGWPAVLRLEPLDEQEAGSLVGGDLPDEVRERIVRTSGGNPLFLTEMAALSKAEGGEVEVPATLRALLVARLDQLDEPERRVLERGAVEGELFHRGTVQALAPEEREVTPRLAALVRRDLVRPDRAVLPREDAYRFRHLLIRDAAYDALPKAARADFHRRFAAWLEEHGQSLVELDEIVGYHLEQAAQYLEGLGRPDPELALAAGDRLAAAGYRAAWRADSGAAASLIERALVLTRPYRFDVYLEADLTEFLVDLPHAIEVADAALTRAEAGKDQVTTAVARVASAQSRLWAGQIPVDEAERVAYDAMRVLERVGDDRGLVRAWETIGVVANHRSQLEDWARAGEQALLHARKAGRPELHSFGISVALALGPRPVGEALTALDQLLPELRFPADVMVRALLLAMLDRTEEAWSVALAAEERARDFGHIHDDWLGHIALVVGDLPAAAAYLKAACDSMEESGTTGPLSTAASRLAKVLCRLGRTDEAHALADKGRALTDADDVTSQVYWREAQALIHSARGQHVDAERLAQEAVTWAERSDSPITRGETLETLGDVFEAAGRRKEAAAAWQEALERYESKGVIPLVRRMRERLTAIEPAHW
ncbi:MAG TPA: AAA family ATPase [Gaiellaceae bacterium]|nr:AAA family ATPase [Gaiellaceae bacterium]